MTNISHPPIVSREQWLEERRHLLTKEKLLTRLRDELNKDRLKLPWVKIDKTYTFDTIDGPQSLGDLFDGRSQLCIYHFMFGPGWQEGCVGCSFLADHFDGTRVHLNNHDVSLAVVSRAPLAELQAFKRRMGWGFNWVSSNKSDFNYDFQVSFTPEQMESGKVIYNFGEADAMIDELPGISAFYRNTNGDVFHTYSAFARGGEQLVGTYMILDMMPKGRNENGPRYDLTDWVRHHDRYDDGGHVDHTRRYRATLEACKCDTP